MGTYSSLLAPSQHSLPWAMPSKEYESSYENEEEGQEDEQDDEPDLDEESSENPPPVPTVVGDQFRIRREIGSGSYSEVYLGIDKKSGEKVAVKIEWQKAEKTGKLLGEAKLYEMLGTGGLSPRVRWSGVQGEYNIMAMDLLGPSLDDLFRRCGRFSLKTVLMLAEQVIDCLEYVHERGILYRDIKPHNFLMGLGEENHKVHIVDFGLAKRYRNDAGEHISCTKKRRSGVTGTVRYSSLNVHDGFDASRRDDLEAAGYVFLHFLRGDLPWLGLKAKCKRTKVELIRRLKLCTSDLELCSGFPSEFVDFFQYCRNLPFAERPDYDYLRDLMRKVFTRHGFERDYEYDWDTREEAQGARQRTRSGGSKKFERSRSNRSRSRQKGSHKSATHRR